MKKKVDENGFTAKSGKDFLDMIAPSTVKFYTDYFICGNTFRCVWALREYPTSTSEQAILRYLGEKEGVTLHISGGRKADNLQRRQQKQNAAQFHKRPPADCRRRK